MPGEVIPDSEVVVIKWLLDNTAISAIAGSSVASQLPYDPPFPFAVVENVRTLILPGDHIPIGEAFMQIDCYSGKNDFRNASLLARTIWAEAEAIELAGGLQVTPTFGDPAWVYGASPQNLRKVPEPETEWARFMVEASFTYRKDT